jgi:hypothetical protein
MNHRLHRWRGITWPAERLLAAQEGLCSMAFDWDANQSNRPTSVSGTDFRNNKWTGVRSRRSGKQVAVHGRDNTQQNPFSSHQTSKRDKHFSLYTNLWKANSGLTKKELGSGAVYDLTGYKESMGPCVLYCTRSNDHYARILFVSSLSSVCLRYLSVHQPTRGVDSVCLFVCLSVNKFNGGAGLHCENI